MKGRLRLSPLGLAVGAIFIVALVALFLGSGGVQIAGLVVAIAAAVFVVAGGLTAPFTAAGRMTPAGRPSQDAFTGPPDPPPDYVSTNPEPTDADWERERAEYRAKQRRERQGS